MSANAGRRQTNLLGWTMIAGLALSGCASQSPSAGGGPVMIPLRSSEPNATDRLTGDRTVDDQEGSEEHRREERDRLRATLSQMIFYDFDQSGIRSDARSVMMAKVQALQADPSLTIQIHGHADEYGSDEYNLALGMRRAIEARRFLVDRGIEPQRIEVRSFGEERPLDSGRGIAALARNRRAEFHVFEQSASGNH